MIDFHPVASLPLLLGGTVLALAVLVVGALRSSARGAWLRRGVLVLLVLLVAVRPAVGTTTTTRVAPDLEVVVAIDRTTSMTAVDWNDGEQRLDGVAADVTALADALPGARFTLLTFAGSTRVVLPSTRDLDLVVDSAELLNREEPWAGTGSSLDEPLPTLRDTLSRMGEEHPERKRMLVLMGDGENTAGGGQRSFAGLEPLVDEGLVLGYGTTAGARMPFYAVNRTGPWVLDQSTGEAAVSRLDEENLQRVASELGVEYLHRSSPGALPVSSWDDDVTVSATESTRGERELTWVAALLLLLVVVPELRLQWRRVRQAVGELA